MSINDLLFYRQQMQPQMPGGDATLGSTGLFVPRGMSPLPLSNQTTAAMLRSRLPTANVNAITDPASVPFFAGGPAQQNLPQFADPRVQAMLPPVPGPARNVGPAPGSSGVQGPLPMQGPPMPAEFAVQGYTKGLGNAGPGAQAYADQFAGGDLSKVRSRLINVDGQMVNDFYTRGLLDAPAPTGPVAPEVSSGGYGPPQPGLFDRFGGWLGGFFGG